MTDKRFKFIGLDNEVIVDNESIADDGGKECYWVIEYVQRKELLNLMNELHEENEQLKKELKRHKDWINSDKNDYELTLSFIKNKGYSLKDVLEYEKELKK